MKLTREQAIREHRKMWTWIARETEKRQEIIKESEYLKKFYAEEYDLLGCFIRSDCFLCEYAEKKCDKCPLRWDSECNEEMCYYRYHEYDSKGLRALYQDAEDWLVGAAIAWKIARLPEALNFELTTDNAIPIEVLKEELKENHFIANFTEDGEFDYSRVKAIENILGWFGSPEYKERLREYGFKK